MNSNTIERYPGLDDSEYVDFLAWCNRNQAISTYPAEKGWYTFTGLNKVGVFWKKDGKCIDYNDVMAFYAKQTATVDGRK